VHNIPHTTAGIYWCVNTFIGNPKKNFLITSSSLANAKKYLFLASWWHAYLNSPLDKIVIGERETLISLISSIIYENVQGVWCIIPLAELEKGISFSDNLHVSKKEKISPSVLSMRLSSSGYIPCTTLDSSGYFTSLGGTIQWQIADYKLTATFDESSVESLTINGKSTQSIEIIPLPSGGNACKNEITWGEWISQQNWFSKLIICDSDSWVDEDKKGLSSWRKRGNGFMLSAWPHGGIDSGLRRIHLNSPHLRHLAEYVKEKKEYAWYCARSGSHDWSMPLLNIPSMQTPRWQSFIDEKNKKGWINEDIFFEENSSVRNLKTESVREELSIKPGDYVVHADHGIGVFQGIRSLIHNKVSQEYFVVSYASEDTLYIPIDSVDRLEKYVGSAHPKIHRLHGGDWAIAEATAREQTRAIAAELLSLYAERSLWDAPVFPLSTTKEDETLSTTFPYILTPDQDEAILACYRDLAKGKPMERLIAGDVGFGKTEVALRVAARVIAHGGQVAWMAPTTVLAQQHFDTLTERTSPLGWRIGNFSRLTTKKTLKENLNLLSSGEIKIAVGTSKLLSPDIQFKQLALLIIDEEQRFGVKDKELLKEKKKNIHVLTLTATPLPRTLNLSLTGVRDLSFLRTPPPGRMPIETHVLPHNDETVIRALDFELKRGGQAYYVHNDVATIHSTLAHLKKLMPEGRFGIAHGQMAEKDLINAMRAFDIGDTNILVCSTIIENGIDLPRANTLIVENATNFGLAQLYQLRGRVGRSAVQAYAYFLYDRQKLIGDAAARLSSLVEFNKPGDGLAVAMRDLELRGIGEVLGSEQSGKIAGVGLGTFTRLLEAAVEEIKSGTVRPTELSVRISLPISYGLPLISDIEHMAISKKLSLYQYFGKIRDVVTLQNAIAEWENTHSITRTNHQNWKNLTLLWEIKIYARSLNIEEIRYSNLSEDNDTLILRFAREIPWHRYSQLLKENQDWKSIGKELHLPLKNRFNDNDLLLLAHTLESLTK